MPTRILNRFWCKECKEFTLHNTWGNKSCITCGTITESYKLSEVPEEKIMEQRARYNKAKKSAIDTYLNFLKPSNPILELFKEDCSQDEIRECDAGQKSIDDEKQRIHNEEINARLAAKRALQEEYVKFKKLGRNDKCACDSGKKYKNCCMNKFSSLK